MWAWIVFFGIIGGTFGWMLAKKRTIKRLIHANRITSRVQRRTMSFREVDVRGKSLSVLVTSSLAVFSMGIGLALYLVWRLVSLIIHLLFLYA